MEELRKVRKIVTGKKVIDGAGVKLARVFGYKETKDFDPFLILDAFDATDPDDYKGGFPWHPHRGIETITYLVNGHIEHGDNLGNKGCILDGDCQWMTAGSGIIHEEMPKECSRMLGVQFWLNLPAKNKMVAPKYGNIKRENIPIVNGHGNKVHIITGKYNGVQGAFEGSYVKATFLDVEVAAGSEWFFNSENEATLFIYILQGECSFDPSRRELISEKHAVVFNQGDRVWVNTSNRESRFLLLSGKPLRESIAWGGPIVMNTREELNLAFRELDENKFIRI